MKRTPGSSKSQRLIRSAEERLRGDLFIVNNPVLSEGLALAPVIAAAVTLQNAVILAVMLPILLIPTRFIGNLMIGYVPQRVRGMAYAIMACCFYVPGYMLLSLLFGAKAAGLGIYLPMLTVDSIIIAGTETPQRATAADSLVNGIKTSLGFAMAVLTVGLLREILAFGKIWDTAVIGWAPLPMAATAAGGFILAALLAAVFQSLAGVIKRAAYRGERAG